MRRFGCVGDAKTSPLHLLAVLHELGEVEERLGDLGYVLVHQRLLEVLNDLLLVVVRQVHPTGQEGRIEQVPEMRAVELGSCRVCRVRPKVNLTKNALRGRLPRSLTEREWQGASLERPAGASAFSRRMRRRNVAEGGVLVLTAVLTLLVVIDTSCDALP